MYTLASVRLLSFWLTATCSSAVKAYTYAYHTCVKRSRVYTFIHSCGRGNGARATRRLPNVYGHVMFHPKPSPFSMFPSPAQLNTRTKSRNGEGLGPRLCSAFMHNMLCIYMEESMLKCSFTCIQYYDGNFKSKLDRKSRF